jgi:hypothetical protein
VFLTFSDICIQVCIDQSKITETLRALPIFLVSCKRMLVVAGPTYVHRLWCIWELHMLFVGAGDTTPEVTVVGIGGAAAGEPPSGTGAAPSLYSKLRSFQLCAAHCYDPNEDRRLRAAIAAAPGGTAAFERAIRGLSRYGQAVTQHGKPDVPVTQASEVNPMSAVLATARHTIRNTGSV